MAATMRLLVVEDEQRLAAGLRKGLEAEGFAVDVVHNGTDGIWMARENPFDAIVLDVMLPGANGYQVCRTLRGEGNWTPILMLTAKDGVWDEVEGARHRRRRLPVQAVLVRGAGRAAAGAAPPRCAAAADRARGRRPPAGSGDAAGVASRRADRPDPREFAMLEYLMRHPGEVLSKRDILDHVWDFDFDGDPNIVEVYVRQTAHASSTAGRRPR